MRNKILITTSSFPANQKSTIGGGNFILELSRKIGNQFEAYVIAPLFSNSLKYEIIEGLKIFRFKFLPSKFMYSYFNSGIFEGFRSRIFLRPFILVYLISQLLLIIKICKKEDIQIIHAHWLFPQGFTAVLYKLLVNTNIKIVCTTHGGDVHGLNSFIGKKIKKFTLKHIHELTVVSTPIKEKAKNLGYNKQIQVIPMGTDISFFHPDKFNPNIKEKYDITENLLLFVGRLTEKKGIRYIIEAIPYIIKNHKETKLIIIGSGILERSLKNRVKELNLGKNIIFFGYISHETLPDYIATCDINLIPSVIAKGGDSEGSPVVLAEAMSCGSIALTSDLPVFKHHIKHHVNGFIVPQRSSELLAKKISYILTNKNSLSYIRENARKYAIDNFSWNNIGDQFINIFKQYD